MQFHKLGTDNLLIILFSSEKNLKLTISFWCELYLGIFKINNFEQNNLFCLPMYLGLEKMSF
jgi:hypothetical protein